MQRVQAFEGLCLKNLQELSQIEIEKFKHLDNKIVVASFVTRQIKLLNDEQQNIKSLEQEEIKEYGKYLQNNKQLDDELKKLKILLDAQEIKLSDKKSSDLILEILNSPTVTDKNPEHSPVHELLDGIIAIIYDVKKYVEHRKTVEMSEQDIAKHINALRTPEKIVEYLKELLNGKHSSYFSDKTRVNLQNILSKYESQIGSHKSSKGYELTPQNTYGRGLRILKDMGQHPLSFKETIIARINDFNLNGDDSRLFKNWLFTGTGILYKKKSTKFKIIPNCKQLLNLSEDFNERYLEVDYNSVPVDNGVIELDRKDAEYNDVLSKGDVAKHPAWIAAMENDSDSLISYINLWFLKTGNSKGMGFYLVDNPDKDQLRALVLNNDNYNSNADGYNDLDNNNGTFVSSSPRR